MFPDLSGLFLSKYPNPFMYWSYVRLDWIENHYIQSVVLYYDSSNAIPFIYDFALGIGVQIPPILDLFIKFFLQFGWFKVSLISLFFKFYISLTIFIKFILALWALRSSPWHFLKYLRSNKTRLSNREAKIYTVSCWTATRRIATRFSKLLNSNYWYSFIFISLYQISFVIMKFIKLVPLYHVQILSTIYWKKIKRFLKN